MLEYEIILVRLQSMLEKYTYCEDNELRIKNGIKYEIYNLMKQHDSSFIKKLHTDLEYKEEGEDE